MNEPPYIRYQRPRLADKPSLAWEERMDAEIQAVGALLR